MRKGNSTVQAKIGQLCRTRVHPANGMRGPAPVGGGEDDGLDLGALARVGLEVAVLHAARHAARQLGRLQLARVLAPHLPHTPGAPRPPSALL